MKQLPIKSPSFNYIEKSFGEWLDILGYAEQTVYHMPRFARELFYYLESKGITHVHQINAQHIKDHYRELHQRANITRGGGLSNNSLNKHLQALYKLCEYLRQSGRLQLPSLNIGWEEKDTETITWLTQEEIRQLYAVTTGYHDGTKWEPFQARDRAILTIFYGCGLRRNEGYYLDVQDINFDRKVLHVRKGKSYTQRFVPFNKTNSAYLQEYIYDSRPQLVSHRTESAFFISQRGLRMQTQSMALRLKLLQQRTDSIELQEKEVRLHVLRHSIATHLLQNGMSLEKISRFLGHSSLESTQVYTHLIDQEINKAQPHRNIPLYETTQLHEDE